MVPPAPGLVDLERAVPAGAVDSAPEVRVVPVDPVSVPEVRVVRALVDSVPEVRVVPVNPVSVPEVRVVPVLVHSVRAVPAGAVDSVRVDPVDPVSVRAVQAMMTGRMACLRDALAIKVLVPKASAVPAWHGLVCDASCKTADLTEQASAHPAPDSVRAESAHSALSERAAL